MVDTIPELVPVVNNAPSPKVSYMELCSMKQLGLTVQWNLFGALPGATQFAKELVNIDPVLERASACADNSIHGTQVIRRNLSASQRGDFSSTDITPQVKLRDELCGEESVLFRPPSTVTVPVGELEKSTPKRHL